MKRLKIVMVAVLSSGIAAGCGGGANVTNTTNIASNGGANAVSTPQPPAANAATPANTQVASGKEIYATSCMICHKDDGKGGKVTVEGKNLTVDDLTSDKMKKRDDARLTKNILKGEPEEGMPAFEGKLTDEEVRLLVQHIRSLQTAQ